MTPEQRAQAQPIAEMFPDGLVSALLDALDAAEAERDRFREHSVILNKIGWRILEALGDVDENDLSHLGDPVVDLEVLITERDAAEARAERAEEVAGRMR